MAEGSGINFGRVIGWSFDMLGRKALPILAVAVPVVGIPAFLVQYWTMELTMSGAVPIGSAWFWVLTLGVSGILVPIAIDTLLLGLVARIMLGRLGSSGDDPGGGIGSLAAMAGALILLSILVTFAVAIGMVLLIVPGVILYIVLIAAAPAMTVERLGFADSLARSAALTAGSRFAIFLLLLLMTPLLLLLGYLVGMVGPLIADITGPGFVAPALAGAASDVVTRSISAAVLTSLYLELRAAADGGAPDVVAVFE